MDLFGTAGIRGDVRDRVTSEAALAVGRAAVQHARETGSDETPVFAVGRDGRHPSHFSQRLQMTTGRRLGDRSTVRNFSGERGLGRRIDDGRDAVERRRVFLPLFDDRFVDVSLPGLR